MTWFEKILLSLIMQEPVQSFIRMMQYRVQRLNQEIAKAMSAGNRMGLNISRAHALRWLTSNAAQSLGLEEKMGSDRDR